MQAVLPGVEKVFGVQGAHVAVSSAKYPGRQGVQVELFLGAVYPGWQAVHAVLVDCEKVPWGQRAQAVLSAAEKEPGGQGAQAEPFMFA